MAALATQPQRWPTKAKGHPFRAKIVIRLAAARQVPMLWRMGRTKQPQYRTTNFKMAIRSRRWTNAVVIERWAQARAELAQIDADPSLLTVDLPSRTLDRWMTGEVSEAGPREASRRILEHLLQAPVEWLFRTYDEAEHLPEASPPQAPSLLGWDSPTDILRDVREVTASNTDPEMLTLARDSIAAIVSRYELGGPHQLAGEARILRRMLGILLRGRQSASQRLQLFSLASQAAALLAYMAVNVGEEQVADALCTEADEYAQEAGETWLRMWVAGTRALNFYYAKKYLASDAVAAAGIALAPRDPQAIRLMANGRARALARLGHGGEAHRLVQEALQLSDEQASLPPGLTSCISFEPYSRARTVANVITAYVSAGSADDLVRVVALAPQVHSAVGPSQSPWTNSLVRLDVATALLKRPGAEVEEAMRVGQAALSCGGVPIQSVRQRASELLVLTQRWRGLPAVREYAAQLNELR